MDSPHVKPEEYRPKWPNRRRAIFASIGIAGFSAVATVTRLAIVGIWVPVPAAEVAGLVAMNLAAIGLVAYLVERYVFGANSALESFYTFLAALSPTQRSEAAPTAPPAYYPAPLPVSPNSAIHGPEIASPSRVGEISEEDLD